jgi:hypothetical protein
MSASNGYLPPTPATLGRSAEFRHWWGSERETRTRDGGTQRFAVVKRVTQELPLISQPGWQCIEQHLRGMYGED